MSFLRFIGRSITGLTLLAAAALTTWISLLGVYQRLAAAQWDWQLLALLLLAVLPWLALIAFASADRSDRDDGPT
jgi:hypothetical protein